MSEPQRSYNNGIAIIKWPSEMVAMRIERIREDARYVSAEVTVSTNAPGVTGHLQKAVFNLNSTSSKEGLVKALTSRMNHLDWYAIVEQGFLYGIEKFREGEPILAINEIKRPDRRLFRLEPLLLEGMPNTIYGLGGLGKSLLATYFSILIEQGLVHTGLSPEQGNVLYLDWEASAEEFALRVDMINRGQEIETGKGIFYRFCYQPLIVEQEIIRTFIVSNHINAVVVDSVGPACGGEPESAEAAIKFFTALRSFKTTTLCIAHVAKNAGGEKGPFGSVYWMNLSRSVWELKKAQETGDDFINIGLYHRKINYGKLRKPIGLHLEFADDQIESLKITKQNVLDIPELAEELPIRERAVALLKWGAKTTIELADEMGKPEDSVRAILNRFKQTFVRVGEGWGLQAHE